MYLARLLLLLPSDICASCNFAGREGKYVKGSVRIDKEKICRRGVRAKGEQRKMAIFLRKK